MREIKMSNARLVSVLNGLNDAVGSTLINKKLPAKLLYAIHRSLPKVHEAYEAYYATLKDVCGKYRTTPDKLTLEDPEQQKELQEAIADLLMQETAVEVHQIAPEVLNGCGEGSYEALTFAEVERLGWLVEEAEDV